MASLLFDVKECTSTLKQKLKTCYGGIFTESPLFKNSFSLLLARDKLDGGVCVIVELPWPLGQGINSYIP